MTGLLRADWIRLRRRYDLWIVLLGVLALAALSFVSGAGSAGSHVPLEPVDPSMPAEAQAFVQLRNAQLEAQIAAIRDQYVFPRSVVTVLFTGSWLFIAVAFVAASWIATEFDWGTIRNVVLIEPRRTRFLAARLISLLAVSVAGTGALIALGALLPMLTPMTGSANPLPVTPGAIVLAALMVVVWCSVFGELAALAAILTRSPILALILTSGYFLLEALVDNLAIWQRSGPPLEWIPQFLPGFRLSVLPNDVRAATGLRGPYDPPPSVPAVHLEPLVGVAVLLAWIALAIAVAAVLLRRADIRE